MKRYNPFKVQLKKALTTDVTLLSQNPSNFFVEEDEFRFAKNAIHALEQISQQFNTSESPTEKKFHAQLDQLFEDMENTLDYSTPSIK